MNWYPLYFQGHQFTDKFKLPKLQEGKIKNLKVTEGFAEPKELLIYLKLF